MYASELSWADPSATGTYYILDGKWSSSSKEMYRKRTCNIQQEEDDCIILNNDKNARSSRRMGP